MDYYERVAAFAYGAGGALARLGKDPKAGGK
jgi:hypothetical protein